MTAPTAEVEAIRAAVLRRFPDAVDGGVHSCRKIAGSDKWSQHAYANAWDIFGPGRSSSKADQDYLDGVYRYLAANRRRLGIGELCWKSHGGCSAANHQDHVHVSGPTRRGTPACAGGPETDTSGGGIVERIVDAARPLIPGGQLIPGEGGQLADTARVLAFLGDPDNWRRIGLGVAGVALLVVAVVLIAKDLSPAGLAAAATSGATS